MSEATSRFAALDVLRGAAVAGMVLVTSPGDWGSTYAPLQHAAWDGWTLTDMIFPTFLFSVGVALGLSFPRSLTTAAERKRFWLRVARRVVLLTLLGLFLEATYNWSIELAGARSTASGEAGLENLRIPGILQRIAFCYALGVIIVIATAWRDADGRIQVGMRAVAVAMAAMLLAYWASMTFIPVPGFGAGRLDPEGNLAAFVDRAIFTTPHLWPLGSAEWRGPVVYDPEGLLSGVPATTNVLLGVLTSTVWRRYPDRAVSIVGVTGAVLFATGGLLDFFLPINKRIWTSSFALLSAGFSGILFAAIASMVRIRLVAWLTAPLRVFGGNAILAFVVATLLGRVYSFPFAQDGDVLSPQGWANGIALRIAPDPFLASLLCALSMVIVVLLITLPFHKGGVNLRL